ncbi:MAG: hypothetical protein HY706_13315 [Candidatus Hydrogenedentes bacterium]|nr:hypothetical protein [Candidatus Hydrogenedentota bacterium]
MTARRATLNGVLATGILLGIATVKCTSGPVEIGPLGFTVKIGEGVLLQDLFSQNAKVPLEYRENFCALPSEQDLVSRFAQVGAINLSQIIHLSALNLTRTTIVATAGDFNFVSAMTVRYVPAPVDGQPQPAITLGSASNPNGLGSTVVLTPPESVDFLELIRANDLNSAAECPQLEIEMEIRSVPAADVHYETHVTIDAFALIGL